MNDMPCVTAGPSLTVFPPRNDALRTLCVIGVKGGGTSFVAGVLRKLGVFMGEDVDDLTGEDRAFQSHEGRHEIFHQPEHAEAKARFLSRATEVIKERNLSRECWGWKDPIVAFYIGDIIAQLRNPVFIFVTRDVGAIAQRLRIDEHTVARRTLLGHIGMATRSYERIADVLGRRARPTLLVSYERALRAPEATGRAIAEFIGTDAPAGFDEWLADYIVADRPGCGTPPASAAARQFASTPAIRALLHESLRPREGGFLPGPPTTKQDVLLAGNRLYETAARLLNEGDYLAARDRALAIINLHVPQFPSLFDGAAGVLAELSFGTGPETAHADIVCGAFYLLGLANLLSTHGQPALICLTVAELLMRRRLARKLPGSILSSANYWTCVLHVGIAAKAISRSDLVDAARSKILGATSDIDLLGASGFAEAHKRAAAEL